MTEPTAPTQLRHPTRTMIRTSFQTIVGLAALLPVLVTQTGMNADQFPWLLTALAVAAGITRVMANPTVEAFLQRSFPWLATRPQ